MPWAMVAVSLQHLIERHNTMAHRPLLASEIRLQADKPPLLASPPQGALGRSQDATANDTTQADVRQQTNSSLHPAEMQHSVNGQVP